jgi:hypothetical protein
MGTKLTKNYRVGNKQNTEFDFSKVEGIHPLTPSEVDEKVP